MPDLDKQLRELIDAGATPITAEEIFDAHPPRELQGARRSPRRHSRRSRGLLVSTVAFAVIAGVTVGLVVIPGPTSLTGGRASAASFLEAAAIIAQRQKPLVPGPGRFLYVATLVSTTKGDTMAPSPKVFWFYVDELVQTWSAPGVHGRQTWNVVGRPEFVSPIDHTVWVTDGSKPLQSGSASGNSAPYYDVAHLPTKPSAMSAYFKSQNYLTVSGTHGRDAVWEFDAALAFLQNGASATQRAALLRFLATIPGVRLMGSATSMATMKRGTLIGLPADLTGLTDEAIFNPSTSQLIETRTVFTSLGKLAQVLKQSPVTRYVAGAIQSYSDNLFVGVSQLGTKPPKSPRLPQMWPSGSTRKPLVVVLDPKTGKIVRVGFQ